MSIKNFSDTPGVGIRDLSARSAVPQPTALPRAPDYIMYINKFREESSKALHQEHKSVWCGNLDTAER